MLMRPGLYGDADRGRGLLKAFHTFRSSTGNRMYPLPTRKHELGAERLYALEVLADAGLWGCTSAMLLAYGLPVSMLADLVRDGLATARRETLRMGDRQIRAPRIWITDAGQRALADAVLSANGKPEIALIVPARPKS
jgi:hypothetical protein